MIQLLFSTNDMIGSRLIRAATFSEWSHVDVITRQGTLVGALATHGVIEYPLRDRLAVATRMQIRLIDGDADQAIAYARGQVGKAYDWIGLLGLEVGRDWQCDDKWFCSELAASAAVKAGNRAIDTDLFRITPGGLYGYTK